MDLILAPYRDRNDEPQAFPCRDKEESGSHDDHPQKRAGTVSVISLIFFRLIVPITVFFLLSF